MSPLGILPLTFQPGEQEKAQCDFVLCKKIVKYRVGLNSCFKVNSCKNPPLPVLFTVNQITTLSFADENRKRWKFAWFFGEIQLNLKSEVLEVWKLGMILSLASRSWWGSHVKIQPDFGISALKNKYTFPAVGSRQLNMFGHKMFSSRLGSQNAISESLEHEDQGPAAPQTC